jgi:hypothetical protein
MVPNVRFTALLTVPAQGKIQLEGLAGLPSTDSSGGYHWQNPTTLTQAELTSLKTLLAEQDGFTGSIAKILAFRVQLVSGTNRHFIFKDEVGELYAAVLYKNARLEEKITYYVKVPTQ